MSPSYPYYAVIFTSLRTAEDDGYAEMAAAMMDLASRQEGFLGMDHARESVGITVSYWQSLQSIAAWKAHADHHLAQQSGRDRWYLEYKVRICRVEKEYEFNRLTDAE